MYILTSDWRKIVLVPDPLERNLRTSIQGVSVDNCFVPYNLSPVNYNSNTNFESKWAYFRNVT